MASGLRISTPLRCLIRWGTVATLSDLTPFPLSSCLPVSTFLALGLCVAPVCFSPSSCPLCLTLPTSVSLFLPLSPRIPAYPCVSLRVPLSLSPHVSLRVPLSLYPSIPLSLYPSIPLSLYPSISLPLYPSIPLSLYPSIPRMCHSLYPAPSPAHESSRHV